MPARSRAPARRAVDVPAALIALGIEFRDRNGEYWANCPRQGHNERTASWSIGDGGGHHCFGCKFEGGILELVLEASKDWPLGGLSGYAAAKAWLEHKGLYIDGSLPLSVSLNVQRAEMPTSIEWPKEARDRPIKDWATPARRYAFQRGITPPQAARWRLRYATGGYYANRILLPTYTRSGALINITGRAWSKTKTPKYLNAKELHGWQPGAIFGEQFWNPMPSRDTLVLCEGELNALACERVGARWVGALGGSQLEKEQVLKLGKFQKVVIAVDMDRAGSDVARALRASLRRWLKCRVVKFPDRRDPNDIERDDPALLAKLLEL